MGLSDQWTADVQRKADERAARWQQRQRERARTGQLTPMERWAAHAQHRSDERAARWARRRREKAASGRVTFLDRYAARAQRKGDETEARWLQWMDEVEPRRRLLASGPVIGPAGSSAVIYVEPTGDLLSRRKLTRKGNLVPTGGSHAVAPMGGAVGLVYAIVTLAIWLAFRRTFTVHVHTNGSRPNIHVRLPSESAAYRAAADLVPRWQAEGPAAVEGWLADVTANHQGSVPPTAKR